MTTEERLENLERALSKAEHRNRWLLAGTALCLGIGFVAWTFGPGRATAQPTAATKDVRASRFIVEDAKGKARAMLYLNEGEPALSLYDEKGKSRAALEVDKDGPILRLYDAEGKGRPMLALTVSRIGPVLTLCDENGMNRAMLFAMKTGPTLSLSDGEGKGRAMLSVFKDGPRLSLSDEKDNLRAALGATATVTPDGKTISYPESSLLFYGPDGKVTWQAPR